jgi:Transcription factor WhiB
VVTAFVRSARPPLIHGRVHPSVAARPYPQKTMFDGLLEDHETPLRAPTLRLAEERRADSATGRQRVVEWLMAREGAPDIETLLAELTRRPAWQARASCRGIDPDLFFPERGQSTDAAKAICAGRDVRSQCLETALTNGDRHGVWDGLSERGRRQLRRAVA